MFTDDAFLAEVEDLLTSIDLPTFPPTQALNDNVNSLPPTEYVAVAVPDARSRKETPSVDDYDLKRELEKAKDRKRRSAYRERRRIERESLQQQVGELSQQLTELEKAQDIGRQLSAAAWEMIVQRQLEARLHAEAYRRQLIAAIDARRALIKNVQGLVRDHFVGEAGEESCHHKKMRLELSDAEFYKSYVRELATLYAQTGEVLRNLESTSVDWADSQPKWREEGDTGDLVYLDQFVVPFDFEQTNNAIWAFAQLPHRQENRQSFTQVEDPENTAVYKLRVTTHLKSGRAVSIRQRIVARRYQGDGLGVIVWRSFGEGEGLFTGMHSDETGWLLVTPSSDAPETESLVRACIRVKPMRFSCMAMEDSTVKEFTGAVLDTTSEDGVEITRSLGKLHLDD